MEMTEPLLIRYE